MRTVSEIIAAAECVLGLPRGACAERERRTHDVSLARHLAYYIARRETRLSFARIAQETGALDHKAILYGFNRISCALAERDDGVIDLVRKIAPELARR